MPGLFFVWAELMLSSHGFVSLTKDTETFQTAFYE